MATAAALFSDFKSLSDQAVAATEKFSNLYYKTFDTQRHRLSSMYTDASTVVWNGNGCLGTSQINDFFINLPATVHDLASIDCQPVNGAAIPNATSILVVCEGTVQYGEERQRKPFSQNFLLVSENNTWKIMSDCFRFIDFD